MYHNSYIKHDDAVIEEEVEFMFELTASLMKHLMRCHTETPYVSRRPVQGLNTRSEVSQWLNEFQEPFGHTPALCAVVPY
jgi:hypothetical protein